MTEQPESRRPKAYREGYNPSPFVFQEASKEGTRVVAWTADLSQLKSALLAILDRFPPMVEVLFKTETGAERERDGWRRFLATVQRRTLVELLKASEELIFSDGGSMLCIRSSTTSEYVALNEHGILFVYSSDPSYIRVCEELGFEQRSNELLFEGPHWHIRPAHHEQQQEWLKRRLRLKYIS